MKQGQPYYDVWIASIVPYFQQECHSKKGRSEGLQATKILSASVTPSMGENSIVRVKGIASIPCPKIQQPRVLVNVVLVRYYG